jgi:hypothetical protein
MDVCRMIQFFTATIDIDLNGCKIELMAIEVGFSSKVAINQFISAKKGSIVRKLRHTSLNFCLFVVFLFNLKKD